MEPAEMGRRPGDEEGAAQGSQGKKQKSRNDQRILAETQREFDGQPRRPITWNDDDVRRALEIIERYDSEVQP